MRISVLSTVAASALLIASVQAFAGTAPMTASSASMPASATSTAKPMKHKQHKKTKPAAASTAPQR